MKGTFLKYVMRLEKLINMGVDGFIGALPYLLFLIKSEHLDIEVSISSFARVNHIRKIEEYINLGG